MATWTGTGAHNANYTGTLTVTEQSYNVASNSSTLAYSLVLTGNSGYYFQQYYLTSQISINGSLVEDRYEQISMPSPSGGVSNYTVCSGTVNVPHNADGTKTVTVWATMSTPTTQSFLPGQIKMPSGLNGSLTLTTIPRESTMTVPAFTIESAGTMTISANSNTFTHTITYSFEGLTGTAASVAAGVTTASWTPPSTFYAKLPSSTSGTATLVLHTYSGGTEIGSKSYSATINVGSSIKPTAPSITLYPVNSNAWLNTKGLYVGGYTRLRVVSSASAGSGASMSSYAVSNAFTATGADVTSSSALAAGSRTVTVTATDSRGRTNSNSKSVSFLPYSNPTVSLSAERGTYSGGSWTSNESGDHIRVTAIPSVSLSANGNTGTVTVKIENTSPAATSGNYYYFTNTNAITIYTVSASITDSVGNTGTATLTAWVTAVASTLSYGTLNIGESTTLTITRNNSNFDHRITANLGSQNLWIGQNIGTSTTWTIPSTCLSEVPNATSISGTITIQTYENGYMVGSRTYSVTYYVPASVKPSAPSITLSPVNTNAWISSQGLYVGGYTKLKVQSSATAGSGASMASYSITGAFTGTGSNVTSGILTAGAKTVTVTATDSRSRTNSNSASVSFLTYTYPSLTTFSAERGTYSGGAWTASDIGPHIRVNAVPSIALSNEGNTATVTIKIGATSPDATSGDDYYFTSTNETTSYTVTGSVSDSVGNSSSRSLTVSTIEVPVNINVDLPGVGFGMIAQSSHAVEIAPNWTFTANGKNNVMNYMPYSWTSRGSDGSSGWARIATIIFTVSTYHNVPIIFDIIQRDQWARIIIKYQNGTTIDPTLAGIYCDNSSVSAFIVKRGTSTWDVYVQKTNNTDRITVRNMGADTWSQTTTDITHIDHQESSVPSAAVMAQSI